MPPLLMTGLSLIAFAAGGFAWAYGSVPPLPAPTGGRRAVARGRAMANAAWFGRLDSTLRRLAALVAPRIPAAARCQLDKQLAEAGYPAGLDPAEFLVATLAIGLLGLIASYSYGRAFGGSSAMLTLGLGLGLWLPYLRVQAQRAERFQQISRSLPGAIDVCALCMGAGLDFAAAVENIVEQAPDPQDALVDELKHLLRALQLGSTRAAALREFERSAPIASVQELVAAIQQGEQKGTPLAQVLSVQAQLLRRRRSVAAEEAAARAAVLLLLPMLLLLGCILVILFAPFAVNGFGL